MKRKAISKSTRFEVFKRDAFRCQYCGAAAPDVVLEVDHLKAVVHGGMDDLLNLITSCKACNSGKGKRQLNDKTALGKQREQLEELNERRAQLELMIRWKEELSRLKDGTIDRLAEYWSQLVAGFHLNEAGRLSLKKLLGQFQADEVMEAMRTAADQYLEYTNGKLAHGAVEHAWSKVVGVCRIRRVEQTKPYIRDLLYIRGILRNRVYVNEGIVLQLLEDAMEAGADADRLKRLAKTCRSWTEFKNTVYEFLSDVQKQRGEKETG